MPWPPVLTTSGVEVRSLRVDNLLPTMDAVYLFQCFNDNAEVLAATVIPYWNSYNHGFVEFASQSIAESVWESYNHELMPNWSNERYSLSWDVDDFGTRWRWDPDYELLSFFGYDDHGNKLVAPQVVQRYGDSLPVGHQYPHAAYPNAYPNNTEHQLDHTQGNGLCRVGYMDTNDSKRLKLTDMPFTPCPNLYQGVYAGYQNYQHPGPSLTIQQYQPYQTQWYGGCGAGLQNNMMRPQHLNLSHGGHAEYVSYQQHSLYSQPCAYRPPYQQLQTQWTVGSDVHTVGLLPHSSKGDLKMVCSMEKEKEKEKEKGEEEDKGKEKEKEKELYLCFNEINRSPRCCYVFRTIKLSDILACSCKLSESTLSISQCDNCAKTKLESQLRQRAWLFAGEDVPASCGGEEARIPEGMGFCASGSHIFFAGGRVHAQNWGPRKPFVPSGDVYSFAPESTSWRKLEWSFVKGKPEPLFFEVNGNFYCLTAKPIEKPTFELYNSRTGKCEVLPDPPFYDDLRRAPDQKLASAIVGTKILVSINEVMLEPFFQVPIMFFDVNDKEKGWRAMTTLFDGKPFPFAGRALVLDLNGTSDKIMFSFRREREIFVSRLVVNVDGDMSVSYDVELLGFYAVNRLMDNCVELSYGFVDLGNEKVGFVLCGNVYNPYKDGIDNYQKVRVVVVVIEYGVLYSKYLMNNILATRCFEYNCHSPSVFRIGLVGSFVV